MDVRSTMTDLSYPWVPVEPDTTPEPSVRKMVLESRDANTLENVTLILILEF